MKNLIKKIWNWIVSIPQDKLLHDYAGLLIAMFVFAICYRFCPVLTAGAISNSVALFVLIGKEIYDSRHEGHTVEAKDILWGCFGILKFDLAALIMFI